MESSLKMLENNLDLEIIEIHKKIVEKVQELEEECKKANSEIESMRKLRNAFKASNEAVRLNTLNKKIARKVSKRRTLKCRILYYQKKCQVPKKDGRKQNHGRPPKSVTKEDINQTLKRLALEKTKLTDKLIELKNELTLLDNDKDSPLIISLKDEVALLRQRKTKVQMSIRYYERKYEKLK